MSRLQDARTPAGVFGLVVDRAPRRAWRSSATSSPPTTRTSRTSPTASQGPSGGHWLGTDHLGRDVLSRLIDGTRVGLMLAVPVIAIALVIGLSVGLASGYHGGRVDTGTIFAVDLLAAFPGLILALILIPLLGVSTGSLILVLTIAFVPPYVRVTRASTLGAKERGYVLVRAGARGQQLAHHVPAHPPQHHPSHPRAGGDRPPVRDRRRGGPVVPRARCAAAGSVVGLDAVRGVLARPRRARPCPLAGRRHRRDHDRLHVGRGVLRRHANATRPRRRSSRDWCERRAAERARARCRLPDRWRRPPGAARRLVRHRPR